MRVLDFTVSGQAIKRLPSCDFSGIVAGSRGYLFARFHFSKDWAGCKKVAVFNGADPVPLVNNMCEIPAEALTGDAVQLYLVGRRGRLNIETDKTAFAQTVRR